MDTRPRSESLSIFEPRCRSNSGPDDALDVEVVDPQSWTNLLPIDADMDMEKLYRDLGLSHSDDKGEQAVAQVMPTLPPANPASLSRPPRKRGRAYPPLTAEQRDERRRKQHRELVARGRARVRERLQGLQESRQMLQKKLDGLVETMSAQMHLEDGLDAGANELDLRDQRPLNAGEERIRFAQAVAAQESLRRQNELLETRIEQHLKLQDAVFAASAELEADSDSSSNDGTKTSKKSATKTDRPRSRPQKSSDSSTRGRWTYFAHDAEPFYFAPYSMSDCERLIQHTIRHAQQLHRSFATWTLPTADVDCLGWKVLRLLEPPSQQDFRFHLSKRISVSDSAAHADQLVPYTWNLLNTPAKYAQLYRSETTMRVLQRLDAATSIVIRTAPTMDQSLSVRTFNLMRLTQYQDSQGRRRHCILVHVLDPQDEADAARQAQRGVSYLHDGFSYVSFGELDNETLEVTYGGSIHCPSVEVATCLLLELTCVCFRWDQMVMPRRLNLS